jgi:hypothetical protein
MAGIDEVAIFSGPNAPFNKRIGRYRDFEEISPMDRRR